MRNKEASPATTHTRRSAPLLALTAALAALAGCGGADGDCRGLNGRAEGGELVLLSRADGGSEQVITETRVGDDGGFRFDDLPDGTYIVRTLQASPDFAGQQPFYKGLYVDAEVTADVPVVCGSGGLTDTNLETR